ncbi:MAG: hypothetical protein EOO18_13010, partial [Chryseobacterium sp.]
MNNKGFNWFIPVLLGLILLIFLPGLLGDSMVKNIDEKEFYTLVEKGKVGEVMVYRDNFKADVYLTKAAKAEVKKTDKESDPLSVINIKPSPMALIKETAFHFSLFETAYFPSRSNKRKKFASGLITQLVSTSKMYKPSTTPP